MVQQLQVLKFSSKLPPPRKLKHFMTVRCITRLRLFCISLEVDNNMVAGTVFVEFSTNKFYPPTLCKITHLWSHFNTSWTSRQHLQRLVNAVRHWVQKPPILWNLLPTGKPAFRGTYRPISRFFAPYGRTPNRTSRNFQGGGDRNPSSLTNFDQIG